MDYQDKLSSFSVNFKLEHVPKETLRRAKLIVLDSVTAIVEGNQSSHLKKLHDEIHKKPHQKDYDSTSIYGTKLRNTSYLAALVNGIAMVSQEKDEGNPIAKGHPSCHFLPALLAFAENNKVSGYKFLESFILGYEIGVRAGSSISLLNHIHPHGNWGLIGSGFAIGKIHHYTEDEYKRSLSLSSSLPNLTLWQPVIEGHRIRDVNIGLNNLNTCLLPSLVRAGFSSSPSSIEEIYGNGIIGDQFESEKLIEGLGFEYYLMKTYFKFYSFCRFCHSPIDAILQVLNEKKLSPEEIERIDVNTYSLAAKLSHQHVNNSFAGKFSIPYAIASMFYSEENQEEILQFAKKIFVYEDDNLTKLLPHQRNARVEVITTKQEKLVVNVTGATGDWNEENLEEKVIEKCNDTLQHIIGKRKADLLVEKLMDLESIDNMQTLLELAQP